MKIAMVAEHASPLAALGGAEADGQHVYVAALAQELGRRGHRVVVHTRRCDPDVPQQVPVVPGVVVDHVDAGPPVPIPDDDIWSHIPAFTAQLAERWRSWEPRLVHAHRWMSGIAALDAAAPLDVPVVQTFHTLGVVKRRHQGAADTSPADRIQAERRIVAEADRIIATCADEALELRAIGADLHRMSVVPCGVNLADFTPEGPGLARNPAMHHRLLTLSRLVPRKGVEDVIIALAQLDDAELVVAGGPDAAQLVGDPEVARLRRVAQDVGVADRVRFLGSLERREVPLALRSADVLVTVPWYEAFGIVPLEAMATGTPVVASAVGGMKDTVVHDVTGLHVPPRDPRTLARVLGNLLADPDRRTRLGAAGAVRARAYGWPRVTDGIERVYRTAVRTATGAHRQAAPREAAG